MALHEALKPLSWLVGKWKSVEALAFYPTMKNFAYVDQLEFESVGQPALKYSSTTWDEQLQKHMHLERGFLKIDPQTNKLAFLVSHNFGLTEISEGEIAGEKLNLESCNIGRTSLAKGAKVTKITREFSLDNGILLQKVQMATDSQPLQPHLLIKYYRFAN